MWKWLVVLGFACFAVACHDLLGPECSQSHKCRLQIESNTSWSGAFGGVNATSSYNGTGNGWIEYWGEVCYSLQKESDPGFLRAYYQETDLGRAETTAPFGVISGCNH